MNLIFCVDDRGGLSFGGRRLSRDRILYSALTEGETLLVKPNAASLFAEGTVQVCPCPMEEAKKGQWCFLEEPVDLCDERIEAVLLCYWNREYPSDVKLQLPSCFRETERRELAGSSHEKLSLVRYERG